MQFHYTAWLPSWSKHSIAVALLHTQKMMYVFCTEIYSWKHFNIKRQDLKSYEILLHEDMDYADMFHQRYHVPKNKQTMN